MYNSDIPTRAEIEAQVVERTQSLVEAQRQLAITAHRAVALQQQDAAVDDGVGHHRQRDAD